VTLAATWVEVGAMAAVVTVTSSDEVAIPREKGVDGSHEGARLVGADAELSRSCCRI